MGEKKSTAPRNHRRSSAYRKTPERDEWQCRMPLCLCPDGRAIDPELRGTDSPWAPSVDHVVERGRGGALAPENMRAAHRKCNAIGAALTLAADKKGWRIT